MNRTLHQLKWDGLKPGSVLTTIRGYDREKAPYNKLTYVLPRNNNDLYGLVDLNSTSGVMTVRKELLSEKRSSIKFVTCFHYSLQNIIFDEKLLRILSNLFEFYLPYSFTSQKNS